MKPDCSRGVDVAFRAQETPVHPLGGAINAQRFGQSPRERSRVDVERQRIDRNGFVTGRGTFRCLLLIVDPPNHSPSDFHRDRRESLRELKKRSFRESDQFRIDACDQGSRSGRAGEQGHLADALAWNDLRNRHRIAKLVAGENAQIPSNQVVIIAVRITFLDEGLSSLEEDRLWRRFNGPQHFRGNASEERRFEQARNGFVRKFQNPLIDQENRYTIRSCQRAGPLLHITRRQRLSSPGGASLSGEHKPAFRLSSSVIAINNSDQKYSLQNLARFSENGAVWSWLRQTITSHFAPSLVSFH